MPRILAALAVTQIIAWGVIGFPTVLAPAIASELGMSVPAVFAGASVMSVTTALASPLFGPLFVRRGARFMMIAGAVMAAPGLAMIAVAGGPPLYFGGWLLIGAGGAAMLTTGAHIFLSERDGAAARGPISVLMVMTGLSSAVFLPLTGILNETIGWRWTCATFALMLGILNPLLCAFALPAPARFAAKAATTGDRGPANTVKKTTFLMIAGAIALNSFTTFGITAVMIQMLLAVGYTEPAAIAYGSAISIVQVSARGAELLGARLTGKAGNSVTTAAVATVFIPVALFCLLPGVTRGFSAPLFVCLFGLSSGILSVARSTIPLAFYQSEDYARVLSRIGLPLNMTIAVSPPLMAWLLGGYGFSALVLLAFCSGCGAFAMLVVLRRRLAN